MYRHYSSIDPPHNSSDVHDPGHLSALENRLELRRIRRRPQKEQVVRFESYRF